MRLSLRPADERVARLVRELLGEAASHLLRADEHDLRRVHPPATAIELLRNALQVLVDELVDVPLVARL